MKPEIRALQIGTNALGHAAGPEDGLWGAKTCVGLESLLAARQGRWGDPVALIQDALIGLGYLPAAAPLRAWSDDLQAALTALVRAGGLARSAAVVEAAPVAAGQGGQVAHGRQLLQGSAGYAVTLFVLHTTATPGDWWKGKTNRQMFDAVRGWHLAQGWRDIGYHGLIFPDGAVIEGRAWDQIGAHVVNHNRGSLGYSMVPVQTITAMGGAGDFYTPETLAAMRGVIAHACDRARITRIAGHNEFAAKLCPGFRVAPADWAPAGWAA